MKRLAGILTSVLSLYGCAASTIPPSTDSTFPSSMGALSLSPAELQAFHEIDQRVFQSGGRTWVVMPRSILALNGTFVEFRFGEAEGLLGPILSVDHDPFTVWIGTTRGVNEIETETLFLNGYQAPTDSIDAFARYLTANAREGVFIVTRKAVSWLDEGRRTWRSYDFDRFDYADLRDVVFANGYIWIATRVGLRRFSREWKAWDVIPGNRELAKTEMLALEQDEDGRLWALATRGLYLYEPRFDTWEFIGR